MSYQEAQEQVARLADEGYVAEVRLPVFKLGDNDAYVFIKQPALAWLRSVEEVDTYLAIGQRRNG